MNIDSPGGPRTQGPTQKTIGFGPESFHIHMFGGAKSRPLEAETSTRFFENQHKKHKTNNEALQPEMAYPVLGTIASGREIALPGRISAGS